MTPGALYCVSLEALAVAVVALTYSGLVVVGASGLKNEDGDVRVLGQSGGQRQAGCPSTCRHA